LKIEEELAFRSSFYFVPKRYAVSSDLRKHLTTNGFEVGVHGLYHDGKLFSSRKLFQERAVLINQYLQDWETGGFRSPAMHYNLEWMHDLQLQYDSSTLDTAPFEPHPVGIGTIFPFLVSGTPAQQGYIEVPCTLPEDFTVFILLKEKTIETWKEKLDWIVERGGMALLITHPDYMNFGGHRLGLEEYPAEYYKEFLSYVKGKYEGRYWHALPREVAQFCSNTIH
jgi:peptidoglycan/xylan/chitin deacetylase (PgdA/CDA1 family)